MLTSLKQHAFHVFLLNTSVLLHWQRWGDEWVAFDAWSGQTVLMDTLTTAILLALEDGPVGFDDLKRQLGYELSIPQTEALSVQLQSSLDDLIKLYWVESIT